MLLKLAVCNFEQIKDTFRFTENLKKNVLEIGVQYFEKLLELHNDLRFLPESMKIEKVKKLVANLHDKTEYLVLIRTLKKALNH